MLKSARELLKMLEVEPSPYDKGLGKALGIKVPDDWDESRAIPNLPKVNDTLKSPFTFVDTNRKAAYTFQIGDVVKFTDKALSHNNAEPFRGVPLTVSSIHHGASGRPDYELTYDPKDIKSAMDYGDQSRRKVPGSFYGRDLEPYESDEEQDSRAKDINDALKGLFDDKDKFTESYLLLHAYEGADDLADDDFNDRDMSTLQNRMLGQSQDQAKNIVQQAFGANSEPGPVTDSIRIGTYKTPRAQRSIKGYYDTDARLTSLLKKLDRSNSPITPQWAREIAKRLLGDEYEGLPKKGRSLVLGTVQVDKLENDPDNVFGTGRDVVLINDYQGYRIELRREDQNKPTKYSKEQKQLLKDPQGSKLISVILSKWDQIITDRGTTTVPEAYKGVYGAVEFAQKLGIDTTEYEQKLNRS